MATMTCVMCRDKFERPKFTEKGNRLCKPLHNKTEVMFKDTMRQMKANPYLRVSWNFGDGWVDTATAAARCGTPEDR